MKPEILLSSRLRVKHERDTVPASEKLLTLEQTREFVDEAHNRGLTVILVEGAWDLTHSGHTQHIREAAKHADVIVMRLASTTYTTQYKGQHRPIEPFRKNVVNELEHVDAVFVDDTAIAPDNIVENAKILAAINPDRIALETEDDKLPLKLASTRYAKDQLGSMIQPVVFQLDVLNSTSRIVERIRSFQ